MRLKVQKHLQKLDKYFYNDRSIAFSIIAFMLAWFIGLRDFSTGSLISVITIFLISVTVLVHSIDYLIYIFDGSIEIHFRKMLDDDGLILPREYSSDRLDYRELTWSDAHLIRELSQMESVYTFVDDIEDNYTKGQAKKCLLQHMNLERTRLRCTRVIVDNQTEEAIGAVVIINGHEVEYWIKESHRNKHYAYEAVKAAIDVIEQEDNIVLFAHCYNENKASQGLLKKIGFIKQDEAPSNKQSWVYKKSNIND